MAERKGTIPLDQWNLECQKGSYPSLSVHGITCVNKFENGKTCGAKLIDTPLILLEYHPKRMVRCDVCGFMGSRWMV